LAAHEFAAMTWFAAGAIALPGELGFAFLML
jgi:hypothetical protein